MLTSKHGLWIVFCVLAFSGCVTPLTYGPMGGEKHASYGYKDGKSEDGRVSILVVIPAGPRAELAYEYWERRAKEVCGGEHYTKNIYRAVRATQLYDYYGGRPGDYYLEGYVTCASP